MWLFQNYLCLKQNINVNTRGQALKNLPLDLPVYFLTCMGRLVFLYREFVSKVISESVQKNVFPCDNAKTAYIH